MVFSSIVFLFRFLPAALIIIYLTPRRYKNIVLTLLSLIFYSYGEAKYILLMAASIFVDYTAGIFIYKYRFNNNKTITNNYHNNKDCNNDSNNPNNYNSTNNHNNTDCNDINLLMNNSGHIKIRNHNHKEDNRKGMSILCLSLIFNLGMLFIFKYLNFFIEIINRLFNINLSYAEITLPLGISFYTFQTMSYSIDVYKGRIEPERNIINFAAFVTLFPQLIAGPIVKYIDIAEDLKAGERINIVRSEGNSKYIGNIVRNKGNTDNIRRNRKSGVNIRSIRSSVNNMGVKNEERIDKTRTCKIKESIGSVRTDRIREGIEKFILGLGRKVLIANNIGMLWSEVQSMGFLNISTFTAYLGILSFSLQIYFDFSGYSLMAQGIGSMLGFEFPDNFNYPYISRSMSEFWRRWHITLGSWFKEYVYIPLGGNRHGTLITTRNLFIVWILTGLWHGSGLNFILWGLMFLCLICIEKYGFMKVLNKHRIFSHIYTLFFLMIGWSLFEISDYEYFKLFMRRLFIFKNGTDYLYYLRNYGISLVIGILFSLPYASKYYTKALNMVNSKGKKGELYAEFINTAVLMAVFIICTAYLVDATYNPFLYFRF